MQNLKMKLKNKKGQGLVEYILVVFLMAIACLVAVKTMGTTTNNGFVLANQKLAAELR